MNLREWNEALFKGVVKDVGREGDPLYFYVDDVVLADISGIRSPSGAVKDFTRAFEATDFEISARDAIKWRMEGYQGIPWFLAAMAITVLAVTLEPIGGNMSNVYRRQNQLLGKKRLGGGIPEDYDRMSTVWSVWNQFLESPEGRKYGTPTAKRSKRYTNQGFARSQAFIRFQDKQDINNFFEEEAGSIPESADGPELVHRLSAWLAAQGSSSRLARVCANKDVEDELGTALLSARKFWDKEQAVRQVNVELRAVPLWDTYEEDLHLVIPLEGVRGTQGVTVRDMDLEEYALEPGDQYAFLSTPYTDPISWLREPIEKLDLNESWTANWSPPESGIYVFVEDEDADAWVGTDSLRSTQDARLLVDESRLPALQVRREQVERQYDVEFGVFPSDAEGFVWLAVDGDSEIPGRVAKAFLREGPEARRTRIRSLSGGLRTVGNTNTYLNGFEPDVVLTAEALELATQKGVAPRIIVDGDDIWNKVVVDGDTKEPRVSLADEFLHPGDHQVIVRVGDQESVSNIVSAPPKTPALFPPIRRKHRHEHIVRFSLERSENPMVFVIPEDGHPRRLELSDAIRYWLQILERRDRSTPRFESFFDSSWLDWVVSRPGVVSEEMLIAARAADREPWRVFLRRSNIDVIGQSPRISEVRTPTGWELIQLLGPDAKYQYVDEGAEEALAKRRREHSRILSELFYRDRYDQGRSRGRTALSPKKWRPDTNPGVSQNPYEYLLWWLTEKGENGVLTSTAETSFAWLCRRAGLPEVPDFTQVVRNLEALGHVVRSEGRLVALPAQANWLPDSEALVAISGARGEDMIGALESGEPVGNPVQDAALDAIDTHVFTQTEWLKEGSSLRVPVAPSTIYVQLGSRSHGPGEQAHALGFELYDPSLAELEGMHSLKDALTDGGRSMTLSGAGKVDLFTPRKKVPGGRWRRLTDGLASLDQDSFLRITSPSGKRYMWWTKDEGLLVDCGWVWGLWGFHQQTKTGELFAIEPEKDRFAVRDYMPFPPDYERFLVMRSGLLPRVATRVQDSRRGGADLPTWRVYTNVPVSVAALVSKKMGHPWSKARGSWPTDLGDLEFW